MSKEPKSLAMIKLEKNFIAHNEKGYPRKPYDNGNSDASNIYFFLNRIKQETKELQGAIESIITMRDKTHSFYEIKSEIADVSNLLDFLFETVCRIEGYWWQTKPDYPILESAFKDCSSLSEQSRAFAEA